MSNYYKDNGNFPRYFNATFESMKSTKPVSQSTVKKT